MFKLNQNRCSAWARICKKDKKELSEDESTELDELLQQRNAIWSKAFITNSTPEGLEKELIATSGYFSCVASEQGLFDSLLGNLYSNGSANNNDLLLNGFDGQYMSSSRVTRESYNGAVIGGVTLFAQHGSVEKVLSASNGTGLAERFLMLAEPHNLGKRDHLKRVHIDDGLAKTYAERCKFAEGVYCNPLEKADLLTLKLTDNGYRLIGIYRNQIEGHLADGEKFAALASLRGAACKIDMQILKIAANLHLLTRVDEYDPLIKDETTKAAIDIADEILNGSLSICIAKGLIGQKSEYMAILSMFEGTKQKDMPSERQILMSRSKVMPFKDYMGNKSNKVRAALHEMVALGILAKFAKQDDGQTCYRLIQ